MHDDTIISCSDQANIRTKLAIDQFCFSTDELHAMFTLLFLHLAFFLGPSHESQVGIVFPWPETGTGSRPHSSEPRTAAQWLLSWPLIPSKGGRKDRTLNNQLND